MSKQQVDMRMAFGIESSQPTSFVPADFSAVKRESPGGEGGGVEIPYKDDGVLFRVKNVVLAPLSVFIFDRFTAGAFVVPFRLLSRNKYGKR